MSVAIQSQVYLSMAARLADRQHLPAVSDQKALCCKYSLSAGCWGSYQVMHITTVWQARLPGLVRHSTAQQLPA